MQELSLIYQRRFLWKSLIAYCPVRIRWYMLSCSMHSLKGGTVCMMLASEVIDLLLCNKALDYCSSFLLVQSTFIEFGVVASFNTKDKQDRNLQKWHCIRKWNKIVPCDEEAELATQSCDTSQLDLSILKHLIWVIICFTMILSPWLVKRIR